MTLSATLSAEARREKEEEIKPRIPAVAKSPKAWRVFGQEDGF